MTTAEKKEHDSGEPPSVASAAANGDKDEVAQLTPQEVTEKLRVMGLPVQLFPIAAAMPDAIGYDKPWSNKPGLKGKK